MRIYIPGYLTLFYIMYFIGHFFMSFAYGLGQPATTALGAGLSAAVMITLWKASACADAGKQAAWGIFAGFFLWCLLGEYLEHERILSLVGPEASAVLVPGGLLIAFVIYRTMLPVGMRFALGHFGCVWLLHAILVNHREVIKHCNPIIRFFTMPALGLAFLLIALILLVKTVRARSKNAQLAFLLSSFIFFWATMETIQAMDMLPDYTCYTYWSGGKASGTHNHPMEETMDKQIAEMEKRYTWDDKQAEKQAYTLIKGLPAPHFIEDFRARLERQLKNGTEQPVDEKLFYRLMEESFVSTSLSAFDRLLAACVSKFKTSPVCQPPDAYDAAHPGSSAREDVDEKIAVIKERYTWESRDARELAAFLLKRFSIQFLTGDDFLTRLDENLARINMDQLGEELLCLTMKEHFVATTRTVFKKLMQSRSDLKTVLPRE